MAASVSIKQEFKKLGETTSIRGVPRALKSTDTGLRVIWAFAVLLCLGLLIWQTTTVCIRYYSRQSSTLFTQALTRSVFPDLTICNLQPLNYIDLSTRRSYSANIALAKETWSCDQLREKLNMDISYANCTNIWWQLSLPRGLFATIPPFDNLEDDPGLPTDCYFYEWDRSVSSIDCYDNIQTVWDDSFYKCYRFQVPTHKSQSVLGFTAVLFINDFFPAKMSRISNELGETMSTGVRLAVHSPGTEPDLLRGIDVEPGVETTVKLSVTERRRLQSPYPSQCTDQKFVTNSSEMLYTAISCYEVCIQSQILERCKCVSGNFLYTEYQLLLVNNTLCGNSTLRNADKNTFDPLEAFSDLYCVNYNISIDYESCIENCNQPCVEYIYETSVFTSGPSPSVGNIEAFYEEYIANRPFADKFSAYESIIANGNLTEEESFERLSALDLIEKNFVQLNIIFERINPFLMKDTPSMTIDNLWAQLGGVLSLWLGITIMTVVEVVELIYTLLQQALSARKARRMRETTQGCQDNESTHF